MSDHSVKIRPFTYEMIARGAMARGVTHRELIERAVCAYYGLHGIDPEPIAPAKAKKVRVNQKNAVRSHPIKIDKKGRKYISHDDFMDEELKNPKVRAAYVERESKERPVIDEFDLGEELPADHWEKVAKFREKLKPARADLETPDPAPQCEPNSDEAALDELAAESQEMGLYDDDRFGEDDTGPPYPPMSPTLREYLVKKGLPVHDEPSSAPPSRARDDKQPTRDTKGTARDSKLDAAITLESRPASRKPSEEERDPRRGWKPMEF